MSFNNNNREDDVTTEEDKSDESKTAKMFDAILKDIKNNGRTAKSISVKSHGDYINLYPLIVKLLNRGKTMSKKDHGLDEVFEIFDEIDNNCHKLNEHNLE